MKINDRELREEIAATRHVLRNLLGIALVTEETAAYIEIFGKYNVACNRVMQMERVRAGKAGVRIQEALKRALKEMRQSGFMK